MKFGHRSILSRLDDAVRWTGIPARVADQLSDAPSFDHKHPPLRWIPLFPIVISCAMFIFTLKWPAQDLLWVGGVYVAVQAGQLFVFYMIGPLGKPSLEDDEREAALRKQSFFFCFGLLAGLNCLGQPILLILSHWQNWPFMHSTSVAIAALMLNATLLGNVPTLYASWHLPRLPKE